MKKLFKLLWKSVLFSVCVIVLIVGILLIREWHRDRNQYWTDMNLSENVDVRWYYEKDDYRIYNRTERKIVEKDVDRVVLPAHGDSLTVFFRKGLRGYLNANTGKVVIPEQYRRAWVFSEGLAAVADESGKIRFINKDNEVVLSFDHTYDPMTPVDYLFYGGYCMMPDDEGKCGMIDKSGHWVVEAEYDYIWAPHHDKYRIAKLDGKYGVFDENFNLIFPVVYDRIEIADEESDGALLTKDGIKQQVAFDGSIIQPFVFDSTSDLYYTKGVNPVVQSDGAGSSSLHTEVTILSDYLRYWIDGSCGVIHRTTGEVIIPALYDDIDMPSSTLFEAELLDVDGSILFDVSGQRIE